MTGKDEVRPPLFSCFRKLQTHIRSFRNLLLLQQSLKLLVDRVLSVDDGKGLPFAEDYDVSHDLYLSDPHSIFPEHNHNRTKR